MILIELTAAVDAIGTLQTFYVSTDGFVTKPSDTPPNTSFLACIDDPGSIGLHAFSDGRTGGATRLEIGEITLINVDGQLDDWVRYSFDGRPVLIRSGISGAYPGSFKTVMVATVSSVDCTWTKVVIQIKDMQYVFNKQARTALYGGTNALPNGLDGVADLKGKVRPRAYGKVFNVSPPMVNTSRLIFETGVCNSIPAVYSNGAALTAGALYVSQADMETNAPSAGTYRAWPAGGYFRIGIYSAEQITADVIQGASNAARTVAQILLALAIDAGLSMSSISAADVTALDALNSAIVGIWIEDSNTTFLGAMDQIAASLGVYYGFDGTGVLRMGQLTVPAGQPKVVLNDYDIFDGIERRAPKDNGVPVCGVAVNYAKNYTVQISGLAGSASARQAFVSDEWRNSNAADVSIKNQWLLSDTMSIDSLLTSVSDADSEAVRLLAMYKVRRDLFEIPVDLSLVTASGLWMLDVIAVSFPRYRLNTGRLFRVIGIAPSLSTEKVVLTIWG